MINFNLCESSEGLKDKLSITTHLIVRFELKIKIKSKKVGKL